ncbi:MULTISPECIES: YqaE/Pmp3 family membrane protein [unclassified Acinetobacter]|uniref:YqaE/Pmp3 family membrane protein n=1 Tax=unclassified Acinetobacter TaxID=196816 RepID=UPI001C215891|nr:MULTISPECIES: YqaE/Pmp3 family membrane protein [unclassified Acinetobacter]
MKSMIAIIFPWSLFMTIHKPVEATICLMLQISILGWIPAAGWAVYILYRDKIA